MEGIRPIKLITHSGKFHADDVFATAWLGLILRSMDYYIDDIIRTATITDEMRQWEEEGKAIIYDIGGGKFDHHQEGSPVRDNGIQYAAFGLVVRAFWPEDRPYYERFDEVFVQSIDESDTTPKRNPLSLAISRFNPDWTDNPTPGLIESLFNEAVKTATMFIAHELSHQEAILQAEKIYDSAVPVTNRVILLSEYAPIYEYCYYNSIDFFIAKGNRENGQWNLMSLKTAEGDNKDLIPEEFRGEGCKNFPGMIFCHKSGFLAAFDSKESAVKFAEEYLR